MHGHPITQLSVTSTFPDTAQGGSPACAVKATKINNTIVVLKILSFMTFLLLLSWVTRLSAEVPISPDSPDCNHLVISNCFVNPRQKRGEYAELPFSRQLGYFKEKCDFSSLPYGRFGFLLR
jgi:hypothetical protein